jgi:hypothetical protein
MCFINCNAQKNPLEIAGIFEAISPNNKILLYKKPINKQKGELIRGRVYFHYIGKGIVDEFFDFFDNITSKHYFFLNEDSILISTGTTIKIFCISKKQGYNLFQVRQDEFLLGLDIKENMVSTLIINVEKSNAKLLLLNLNNNEKRIVNIPFKDNYLEDFDGKTKFCNSKDIVIGFQNSLYIYDYEQSKIDVIEKQVFYSHYGSLYAVLDSSLIYLTAKNQSIFINKHIIRYDKKQISEISYLFNKKLSKKDFNVFTSFLFGKRVLFFRIQKYKFIFNETLTKTNDIILYENQDLRITLLNEDTSICNFILMLK